MPDRTCPLCRGPLAPCVMITGRAGQPVICSQETDFFSLSGRRYGSTLQQEVCVDCGLVLSFAATPGVFREALRGESGSAASLPIPHAPAEEDIAPSAE